MISQEGSAPLAASNAAAIGAALWDSADFAGAGAAFERALHQQPDDLEALHGLGRLRLAQNDLAGATLLLERALERVVSWPDERRAELERRVRRDLAWTLYRLDRFELAAEQMRGLPEMEALAAQLHAFGERVPYRMEVGIGEVEVPFWGTDPLPIVPLTIGGVERAFVLDTGSSQLVVDSSLLEEQGLPNFGTREVAFASGQRARIAHTIVPQLQVGELALHDVPAEVMELRRFAPQLFGLIGTNLLQRFHVHCDWNRQLLRLRPGRDAPFVEWATMTKVPFWYLDSHLLLARASLEGYPTMAFIASGMAGASFAVPPTTVAQAGLRHRAETMDGVGAAGATLLESVQARHLSLGDWDRSDVSGLVGFFPPELEWRFGFRVGALLGHSLLSGEQWGLDFVHAQFFLR